MCTRYWCRCIPNRDRKEALAWIQICLGSTKNNCSVWFHCFVSTVLNFSEFSSMWVTVYLYHTDCSNIDYNTVKWYEPQIILKGTSEGKKKVWILCFNCISEQVITSLHVKYMCLLICEFAEPNKNPDLVWLRFPVWFALYIFFCVSVLVWVSE